MRAAVSAVLALLLMGSACAKSADTGARTTPRPFAQEIEPPKVGTYVYAVSGSASKPGSATTGKVVKWELTEKVTAKGDEYTSLLTNSVSPSIQTTVLTRWEPKRVLLLSTTQANAGQTSTCTFEPPIEIIHRPIVVERFKTQTWETGACSGTTYINVAIRERVNDDTGREWSAWRFEVRTSTRTATGSTLEDETRWLSAELGVDVRSTRTAEGQQQTDKGETTFHHDTETTLKSHP